LLRLLLALSTFVGFLLADSDDNVKRLEESAAVLTEIMDTPDKAIPQDLLDRAECIVIVPGLKKGAFILGAKYGRGFLSCRHAATAGWSAPAAVRVEGGSVGFQIGGSETDAIMLIMNRRGADKLLNSKFTLGGDASVAAGPVGRSASAETDAYLRAEILTYSRSRGVFAGVSLQGATLRQDLSVNKALYGKEYTNRQVVNSGLGAPKGGEGLLSRLNKYSSRKGR
jgi:lipid-binding SYLF domain-containing protein